jgi:MFS family permease
VAAGLALIGLVPRAWFIPEHRAHRLLALGNGMLWPSSGRHAQPQAEQKEQGEVLGMNQSFGSLARIAGPCMGGRAYELWHLLPYLGGPAIMLGALYYVYAYQQAKAARPRPVIQPQGLLSRPPEHRGPAPIHERTRQQEQQGHRPRIHR